MNTRTLAALTAAALIGCGKVPHEGAKPTHLSRAKPTQSEATQPVSPQPPVDPNAWKKVTREPITAEILSVEVRPVKVKHSLASGTADGPVYLIVRVKFANSDDTFRASSLDFVPGSATDEYDNTYRWQGDQIGTFLKVDEPNENKGLTPDSTAVRTFVCEAPIPKAKRITFTIRGTFDRARAQELTFPFVIPLPDRK